MSVAKRAKTSHFPTFIEQTFPFGNSMNITGMLTQPQRQISSPNGRQKHERNTETDTDKKKSGSL